MVTPDVRDEPALVAALLSGVPAISRNRHFELMSSDIGRRARRRAGFLRSIDFVRRAYLTTDEVSLLGRVFPLVARVIEPHSHD